MELEGCACRTRLLSKMNYDKYSYIVFSPNRNCWGSQFILQRVDGQDDLGT